jgi:hypothetical protein
VGIYTSLTILKLQIARLTAWEQGTSLVVSIPYAECLALSAVLALTELWLLRAIVQEFLRQLHRQRVHADRQESKIARRLRHVGGMERASRIEHAKPTSDVGPDQPTYQTPFQVSICDDPLRTIAAE